LRKKFNISKISSKIFSIFAGLSIVSAGVIVPLAAANAAELDSANSAVDFAGVFDGSTTTTVTAASATVIPSTAAFTIESWIYPTASASDTNNRVFWSQGTQSTGEVLAKRVSGNLVLARGASTASPSVSNVEYNCGPVPSDAWTHVAFSMSSTEVKCFVNGALAFTKTTTPLTPALGSKFNVGSWSGGETTSAAFWQGQIDQVKVWNAPLSEAQVAESMHSYQASGITSAPTLLAHYDFNEGVQGTTSTDQKVYNRATADLDLTATTLTYDDVKKNITGGNIDSNRTLVYKFPRTYLTSQGGWTVPSNLTAIEALTVGGGGGGGENVGNGGSGGSVAYHSGFALTSGSTLEVKVGQGGHPGVYVDDTMAGTTSATWTQNSAGTSTTGIQSTQRRGGNGQTSTLIAGTQTLAAPGGVGGQSYWNTNICGSIGHTSGVTAAGSAGTGGTTNAAGATGGEGNLSADGGVGSTSTNSFTISGSAYKYGAGGAGANGTSSPTAVAGGADGGGTASNTSFTRAGNGAANSGSGGAGGNTSCSPGGAGGSGVVYVRTSAVKINAITGAGSSVNSVSGVVSGPTGNFVLALSTTGGNLSIGSSDLTTSGATKTAGTGSEPIMTYSGTIAQLHAALNYTKLTLRGTTGSATIKYELNPVRTPAANQYFNQANGHYYSFVSTSNTWTEAKAIAVNAANNQFGLNGYLTNVTSAAEFTFIRGSIATNSLWTGGRYDGTNWLWDDGPETGTVFWNGVGPGTAVAGQYNAFLPSEPNGNQDRVVTNYQAGGTGTSGWDNQTDALQPNAFVVEYGGRTTDPGVTSASVTITLGAVNVNFTELNFNYTAGSFEYLKKLNVDGTDSTTAGTTISANASTGKAIGDRVLFKAVTVRNGVTVDAIVTTKTIKSATIKNYEANTNAGGAASNFQADVDISAANGYAEFQFDFYQTDASIVANCNAAIACTGSAKVILENVNVSIIDIDYYQWNDITGVDSYTVTSDTKLKECLISGLTSSTTCTARVNQSGLTYPADLRFQGPSAIDSTLPQDMAIANYGSIETFKIKFGRDRTGSPNYYGVAFKALPWGSATPVTFGPVGQNYTIAYNANGSTSGSVPSSHSGAVGANFTTATNSGTLVNTGYTFGGWNTAANGTGTQYAVSSGILMPKDGATLYAVWIPSQFTLTYNANLGTAAPAAQLRNSGSVANLSSTAPTRTGYTFAGWDTAADGSGTDYAAGASFTMPGANTTLYARWTGVSTAVDYNGNTSTGGTVPSTTTAAAGSTTTVSANTGTLVKTGYTFAGWNTAADGSGTDYAAGATVTYPSSGTTTLYAQWTAVLYSLSYNANGGVNSTNGATPSQSANSGATVTLAASTYNPTRAGYTFDGWYTTSTGAGGTLYAPGATNYSMPAVNTVLYAKWTAVNYNITYDKNDASATGAQSDTTNYNLNAQVTVLGRNDMALSGYRFVGWNTAANGSGLDYVAGNTFNMPLNGITLYAKWVLSSVVLTYDANGGNNAPPADTHTANTPIALPSTIPTKDGYTFLGWCTNLSSCPSPLRPSGDYTTPATDGVLYAKWAAIDYTFIYNTNGGIAGAGAPTSITGLNVGGLVTIYVVDGSHAAPSRTGYSFTGWNAAANGSSTNYTGGSTYTMGAGNYTIYAQWLGDPFTLTYNSNGGGALSSATEVRRAGSISNITSTTPTRTGYTFSSWNTAANGSGQTYGASGSLTMPAENVTLYAQWTLVNNGVSYNANNGSGAPSGSNYNFDEEVTVSSAIPTRSGYTFTGWNTQSGGGGNTYTGADTFNMPNQPVVLYAQWSVTAYVLIYDANGGVNAQASSNKDYATTVTVTSAAPTKAGYDFQGWNTAQAGSGTSRTAGSTFSMPASNLTLYAQWSLATFTVYYNANGGSGSINPQPGRYGSTITLSNSTPIRNGYTFAGWNTAPDASGVDYTGGGTLTLPANNVTLYAKWTATPYTLTYSANGGDTASVPAAETGKNVGEAVTLSATVPTKTGYWFNGWNSEANGNGATYSSAANFTMPASNVTLYAVWVINTHTVSYNANGGTGAPAAQETTLGSVVIPSTPNGLLKPGYTFSHWYTTQSGTGGTRYDAGNSFSPNGNAVLYAIWTPNVITVTYDITSGTGTTPDSQTAPFGGQPIQLAGLGGFSKASSTFLTWNTVADGSGTSYAPEDPNFRVPSSNVTLYAIWSAAFFAVEYNPNGGTGAPSDQFAAPGQTVNVAPAEPVLAGHDFVAWSDVSTGNTYSANSAITMPTANVTLVANYVRRSSVGTGTGGGVISTPVVTPPANKPPTTGVTYPKKLNLTVYFKGDRSYLTTEAKTALKKLAATAKQYGYATNITIYGRVKETNDKSYDTKLSSARAKNVAAYLKKLGVSGAFKVIAAGISPENKSISRRVDLQLFWTKR
jgi:uncharacterized repeat protein (TIGR02543 family)